MRILYIFQAQTLGASLGLSTPTTPYIGLKYYNTILLQELTRTKLTEEDKSGISIGRAENVQGLMGKRTKTVRATCHSTVEYQYNIPPHNTSM